MLDILESTVRRKKIDIGLTRMGWFSVEAQKPETAASDHKGFSSGNDR